MKIYHTEHPPHTDNYFDWCKQIGASRLYRDEEDSWKIVKEAYELKKKAALEKQQEQQEKLQEKKPFKNWIFSQFKFFNKAA